MRIKAWFTIFFVLTGIFSCNFVYAEDSEYNASFVSASEFLSQLGINNDITKACDEEITRAEFAALVVRSVNASGLSADEEVFMDCTSSPFVREISIAKVLGITCGTSQSRFSPNGNVTYQVAAKMLVCALGGNLIADNKGGYPTGYTMLANSLDLFDGTLASESAVTVGDAYIMIVNALTAPVTVVTGISGEDMLIETDYGESLLTKNFHLECFSGVATTAGIYSVRDDYTEDNMLEVGGRLFKSSVKNTEKYLGHTIDAWYNKDTNSICAVYCGNENKTLEINAEDVISYADNTLTVYTESDKNKRYTIEKGFTYVVNGRAAIHSSDSFAPQNGTLLLIDNDSDGKYEFVQVSEKEYFVVRGINLSESTIYDSQSSLNSISLENYDGHHRRLTVNSADADINSLTENMVCEVYMSGDGEVCIINAAENLVNGKLTACGDDEITVNSTVYKPNSYFDLSSVTIGETYGFLVAPDGTLTDISNHTDSMQYGYLLGFSAGVGSFDEPAVKLLTAANTKEVYCLDSKIKLDGQSISSSDSRLAQLFLNGDVPNYQLIRYKLNDGKIKIIDTAIVNTDAWDVNASKDVLNSLTVNMEKSEVFYRTDSKFGIPNVAFSQATVFHVPKAMLNESGKAYDDDMFVTNGTTGLTNDTRYTVDVFDFSSEYLPRAVVVYTTSTKGTLTTPVNTATPYLIWGITTAVDDDGEILERLKVYGNGKYEEFFISAESYKTMKSGNKLPSEGDVVRLSFDSRGYVNGIATDIKYDKSAHSLSVNYGVADVGTSPWAYLMYFTGYASAKTGNYLAIDALSAPEGSTNSEGIMNLYLSSPKYIVYNAATGEVEKGDSSSIITEAQGGTAGASLIAVRSCYYSVNTIYVYMK